MFSCTTVFVPVQQSLFLYYEIFSCTTAFVPVLLKIFLYYTKYSCAAVYSNLCNIYLRRGLRQTAAHIPIRVRLPNIPGGMLQSLAEDSKLKFNVNSYGRNVCMVLSVLTVWYYRYLLYGSIGIQLNILTLRLAQSAYT